MLRKVSGEIIVFQGRRTLVVKNWGWLVKLSRWDTTSEKKPKQQRHVSPYFEFFPHPPRYAFSTAPLPSSINPLRGELMLVVGIVAVPRPHASGHSSPTSKVSKHTKASWIENTPFHAITTCHGTHASGKCLQWVAVPGRLEMQPSKPVKRTLAFPGTACKMERFQWLVQWSIDHRIF